MPICKGVSLSVSRRGSDCKSLETLIKGERGGLKSAGQPYPCFLLSPSPPNNLFVFS